MFKFLKDKLKGALSKISKKVEDESTPAEVPQIDSSVNADDKQGEVAISEEVNISSAPAIPPASDVPDEKSELPQQTKSGFFSKIKSVFAKKSEEKEVQREQSKKAESLTQKEEAQPQKSIEQSEIDSAIGTIPQPSPKILQEETPPKKITESPVTEPQPAIPPVEKKPDKPAEKIEPRVSVDVSQPALILQKEKTPAKKPEAVLHKEPPQSVQPPPPKKGFFGKISEAVTTTKINQEKFEQLFWELELALLENNVAVEVIDKIKGDLRTEIVDKPIKRNAVEEILESTLKNSIAQVFLSSDFELVSAIRTKERKPYVIVFFGINGSGKTTSIAKLAKKLKDEKLHVVIAAGDTFRAASIEQLSQHGDTLGVKVIKHDYGSDPAAVAFDAIKHAQAKNADVVLVDTAGRMHSNKNLIDEMKKIVRVAQPDLKIFVGESITGNDCVEQAKTFNDAVGIDGIILSKVDVDEKGGAAVSVSYVTQKPILYLGVGQEYDDLQKFDADFIVKNLGLA